MNDALTVALIWLAVSIAFCAWWARMMRHVRAAERERRRRYPSASISELRRRQLDAFLEQRVDEFAVPVVTHPTGGPPGRGGSRPPAPTPASGDAA